MRRRPAPSAARTDSSRARDAPRASCRLATFAHAISSTTATALSRIDKRRSARTDDRLPERQRLRRPCPVRRGNESASCFSIAVKSRRAPLDRDAGFEPPDDAHAARAADKSVGVRVVADRHHDVGNRAVGDGLLRRHDADDRERRAVQHERFAEHRWIAAEARLPTPRRENRERCRVATSVSASVNERPCANVGAHHARGSSPTRTRRRDGLACRRR